MKAGLRPFRVVTEALVVVSTISPSTPTFGRRVRSLVLTHGTGTSVVITLMWTVTTTIRVAVLVFVAFRINCALKLIQGARHIVPLN